MQSKTIDCQDKNERLLDVLLRETDWMHSCGGKGRCTTCKAVIHTGLENLPPMNEAEMKFLNLQRLQPNERLTCQVKACADLEVSVAEENKLPHLDYSE